MLLAVAQVGCATTGGEKSAAPALTMPVFEQRADRESVLVLMPVTVDTIEVLTGFSEEVGEDYNIIPVRVGKDTSLAVLEEQISSVKPVSIVLMNNPTVSLYRKYQGSKKGQKFPPSIIVMSSFVSVLSKGLSNVVGVSYEVPGLTSFVNLRSFLDRPVRRVGVIHRGSFHDYLETQQRLAAKENFELIRVEVGNKPSSGEVKKALGRLKDRGVDAIWVLNDNQLLKSKLISRGWLPPLSKNPVPVIVGVSALVSKKVKFGSLAITPDHLSLGAQTAEVFFELEENDWVIEESGQTVFPVSVKIAMDVETARRHFKFKEEQLGRVDRVVE